MYIPIYICAYEIIHFKTYIYIYTRCSIPRTTVVFTDAKAWRAAGKRFAPESIASWALKYVTWSWCAWNQDDPLI